MLKRKGNGKLSLSILDLEIFMGDLFEQCKTIHEIEWLSEQLQGCAEVIRDERTTELEDMH